MSEPFTLPEALVAWVASRGKGVRNSRIESELVVNRGGDSPSALARATVWSSGYCDVEMLDYNSGDQVFWKHHDAVSADALHDVLHDLVSRLQHHEHETKRAAVDPALREPPLLERFVAGTGADEYRAITDALADPRKHRIELNFNVFDLDIDVVRATVTIFDVIEPNGVQRVPLPELLDALAAHAAKPRG